MYNPDLILRSTLSLYMEDMYFPLPTPEEVLLCNPSTTTEEVTNSSVFILLFYYTPT